MTGESIGVRALTKLRPAVGMDITWRRQRAARQEPLLSLIDALVWPGDVALDIGASYGFVTSRLARLVSPDGEVHAFEPNPRRHSWLNRVRSGRPWVTIHPVGLSDHPGVATLNIPVISGTAHEERASVGEPQAQARREERTWS